MAQQLPDLFGPSTPQPMQGSGDLFAPSGDPAPQQSEQDLPQGATAHLPMSRQIAPDNFKGQGEAYYGDPNGQVGGFGIRENIKREAGNYIEEKQKKFYAQNYVKQDDGTYKLEDPNLLQYGARTVESALGTVGDIFNVGTKATESALGASRGLEDLADMSGSALPDILKQDTGVNLFLQPALNVYNALRIATGNRQLVADNYMKVMDANLQASKISYSTVADPMLREEFIRRYLSGENPDFLAKELENPWHEMIGQVALDPLNVIGSFAEKAGKAATLAKMVERYKTPLEAIEQASKLAPEFEHGVVAGIRTMDAARAAEVIPDVAKVVSSEAVRVAEGLKKSEGFGNKLERVLYTSTARREELAEHVSAVTGPLFAGYGNDPDSAAEMIKAMTILGSGDAKKTEEALYILKNAPADMSNIALSQGGMETSNLLHRMYGEKGIGEFFDLIKTGDKEKIAAEFTSRFEKASAELYPTVSEKMAGLQKTIDAGGEGAALAKKEMDAVPGYVKNINAFNENAKKIYGPLNTFFGNVYIIGQPGVGVRNVLTNMTHAFIDLGPEAVAEIASNSAVGVGRAIAGKGGQLLPSDVKTVEMLGALPHAATESIGQLNDASGLMGKLGEVYQETERTARSAVVYTAAKNVMKNALKEGGVVAREAELVQAGLSQGAARRYIELMQGQTFGDHGKAWSIIQKEFDGGTVETFRNIKDWASPADLKNWEQSGVLGAIQDATHNSKSLNEAVAKVDAIVQKQLERAAGVFDEVPANHFDDGLDNMDLAGPMSDLQTEHTLKRMAASNAKEEFRKMAFDILNDPQAPPSLRQQLFDFMGKSGKEGQESAASVVKAAEDATRLANNAPDAAWAVLQKNQFGKTLGPRPESLTGQSLRDFIWDTWARPTRSKIWTDVTADTKKNTVMLAQQALEALGKDPKTLLQSPEYLKAEQAFQYSKKVESAQYVSGKGLVYDGVEHALRNENPVEAISKLAKRYGISTASEAGKPSNELLNIVNKYSGKQYKSLDEFIKSPTAFDDAQNALKEQAATKATAAAGIPMRGDGVDRRALPKQSFDMLGGKTEEEFQKRRWLSNGLSGRDGSKEKLDAEWGKVWEDHKKNGTPIIPGGTANSEKRLEQEQATWERRMDASDRRHNEEAHPLLSDRKDWRNPSNPALKTTPTNWSPAQNEIVNFVRGDRSFLGQEGGPSSEILGWFNKDGLRYRNFTDIPKDELLAQIEKNFPQEKVNALKERLASLESERLPTPRFHASPDMPTSARLAAEGLSSTSQSIERFKQQLQHVWGRGETVKRLTPEIEKAMAEIGSRSTQRMMESRVIASAVANETTNFTLLNYKKKTYLDLAMAYAMPYGFFQAHTTATWIKRLVTNPEFVAGYFKYRKFMEDQHANLPDWWKYNINSNELLGIQSDHPLFLNLEATLNPLNGITGVDFTDPEKVVGAPGSGMRWWTQTLDSAGKFGPSIWTPITMATAVGLYASGQKDAAARWAGRLIPQTAAVKAISSEFGKPLELDPAVNLLSDGKDPYEASRIGRAMAALIQEGAPEAAALQQMHDEKGPIYDEAYRRAVKDRAPYQMLSFVGGTGFKARTPEDMKVDQFYEAYRNFWANYKNMAPDEFNTGMVKMHKDYPFMDSVLLSKKDGLDRDRGYAYSVMTRIAPGDTAKVGSAVGLDPRLLDKFYQDKGDTTNWTKSDRDIFYAKIVDIGATLDVPPNAVRQEWTLAKNEYLKMGVVAKNQFGSNIDELVNGFYAQDTDSKNQYLTQHPTVQQYLDWKAQYVVQEPLLATYYNGMGQLRNYYDGKFRAEAEKTFGPDVYQTVADYYTMKDTRPQKEYDAYYRQHPEIKKYFTLKDKWDVFINNKVVDFGKMLPEGIPSQVRPDAPQGSAASLGQQDLQSSLQNQAPQWKDVAPSIASDLKNDIAVYFQSGKALSYTTSQRLTRIAKQMNMSLDDFLTFAGQAMQPAQ